MLTVDLVKNPFPLAEKQVKTVLNHGNTKYVRKASGSFLSSCGQNITRQALHTDSMLSNEYQALVVLSEGITPTEFLIRDEESQSQDEITNEPQRYSRKGIEQKILNEEIRRKVERRFEFLLRKPDESQIWPISKAPLELGDLIIFAGDTYHRGAAWSSKKDRKIMFFTYQLQSKQGKKVAKDYQFHSVMAAYAVHGINKHAYKVIQEMNDPEVLPPLYKHMDDGTQKSYLKFIENK